jgi:hypothetical protein
MLGDYLVNLAAEITFLLLVLAAGWTYVLATQRRPLLRFFRVENSRRLVLYWSRLFVTPGGSVGEGGEPRSFAGTAVPFTETLFLPLFQRLFNYVIPGLEGQPGVFRRLLLADVAIRASVAPPSPTEIDATSSIVSFGSPGYNVVSRWIEYTHHSIGQFVEDNQAVQLPNTPPIREPLSGFVQRVLLPRKEGAAFYVAGISSQATMAAAYFLFSRWLYLRRRFGDDERFCVVLRADPTDFRLCTVLMERGE